MGDGPHCRKCGFDLRGNPEAERCGECGADLGRRGAVVIGERQRRSRVAVAAGVGLLASFAWLGTVIWAAADASTIQRYKPLWLLAWDLDSPTSARAALDELERRLITTPGSDVASAKRITGLLIEPAGDDQLAIAPEAVRMLADAHRRGQVDGKTLAAFVDPFLDLQADPKHRWDDSRGDLIIEAWQAGQMSEEQLRRYIRQAVSFEFVTREVVRAGDPLPWRIVRSVPRGHGASGNASPRWKLAVGLYTVTVDGVVVEQRDDSGGYGVLSGAGASTSGGGSIGPDHTIDLARGEHALHYEAQATVTLVDPASNDLALAEPVVVSLALDAAVESVTADDEDPIQRLADDDPAIRIAARNSIDASPGFGFSGPINGKPSINVYNDRWRLADVRLSFSSPPVPLAFELILRDPQTGDEWAGPSVTCPAGRNWGYSPTFPRRQGDRPIDFAGPGELILRASRDAAADTVDLDAYWGGDLVFEDVPLDYGDDARASTRPATRPNP